MFENGWCCILLVCLIIPFHVTCAKAIGGKSASSLCKESIGIQTGFLETRDIKTSTSQANFTSTDPWCATVNDDKQYFAVDLGEDFSVSKIATQGKLDDKNRFVNMYTLDYSSDAKKWTEYKDVFGKSDLEGNKNTFDVVTHDLAPAIIARYIKVKPKKWNNGICMTTDLFGCATEDLKNGKVKKAS